MAHVHGAKGAAEASTASAAPTAGGMMGPHGPGMMKGMMGSMAAPTSNHNLPMPRFSNHNLPAAAVSSHNLATGAATAATCPLTGMAGTTAAAGMAATASTSSGRNLMSRVLKHPVVMFGLGLAVGYLAHKYRKEIIAGAVRAGEQGKDFVLQQKESLEDLVASGKEQAEGAAKPES